VDGTPITLKEMNDVREAIHKNMVFSPWKKGDIPRRKQVSSSTPFSPIALKNEG
jgi:hypothetical protein